MIFFSASAGIYTIINTLSGYLDYDVITQTKHITEKVVTFPAVAICSYKLSVPQIKACRFKKLDCKLPDDIDIFKHEDLGYQCIRFNGIKNESTLRVLVSISSLI